MHTPSPYKMPSRTSPNEEAHATANDDRTRIIPRRTPEAAAVAANIKRAMAITARLNRLTYDDAAEVRALSGKLIGRTIDDGFLLIPPFHATGGPDTSVGRNVCVNQNCTFYDLGARRAAVTSSSQPSTANSPRSTRFA